MLNFHANTSTVEPPIEDSLDTYNKIVTKWTVSLKRTKYSPNVSFIWRFHCTGAAADIIFNSGLKGLVIVVKLTNNGNT